MKSNRTMWLPVVVSVLLLMLLGRIDLLVIVIPLAALLAYGFWWLQSRATSHQRKM